MHIADIETVQMRARKLFEKFKYSTYQERLKRLKPPTLKYRRLREDMIEIFKMVHGFDDELDMNE